MKLGLVRVPLPAKSLGQRRPRGDSRPRLSGRVKLGKMFVTPRKLLDFMPRTVDSFVNALGGCRAAGNRAIERRP